MVPQVRGCSGTAGRGFSGTTCRGGVVVPQGGDLVVPQVRGCSGTTGEGI